MNEHDTPHDPRKLDRYLLGRLSEEESHALEADLLHDRRLFDLAEAAEADLVDRFVRGELTPDDRKRFERHLLPSERIRERVATARALRRWTDRRRAPRVAAEDGRSRGSRSRAPRLAWAAALIAAIAAGALGFEVARLHDRLDGLEPSAAAVDARAGETGPSSEAEPSPAEPAPSSVSASDEWPDVADADRERADRLERELSAARERIASLESTASRRVAEDLSPEDGTSALSTATVFLTLITRGVHEEEILDLDDADLAEIHLELGRRRPSGKVRAEVTRDGTVLWSESDVEVLTEAGESMARLVLPRQVLLNGHHRVELVEMPVDAAAPEEPLATYPFSVRR